MDKLSLYYKTILERVDELVENKKIEEAIMILQDELDTPYIPKEFLEKFEDKLSQLNADKNYFLGIKNFEKYPREKLLKAIRNKNNVDQFALTLFMERFRNSITINEIDFIETLLVDPKVLNEEKVFIFKILKINKIFNSVKFYNSNLKEYYSVSVKNTLLFQESLLFRKAELILRELTFKEPTLYDISKMLLEDIFSYYFPSAPDCDAEVLSYDVFRYVMFSLQGGKIKSSKIVEVILEILRSKN